MLQGGNEQLASKKYLRKEYVWYKFSVDIVLDIHPLHCVLSYAFLLEWLTAVWKAVLSAYSVLKHADHC